MPLRSRVAPAELPPRLQTGWAHILPARRSTSLFLPVSSSFAKDKRDRWRPPVRVRRSFSLGPTPTERQTVLDGLHSKECTDLSSREVYATLPDGQVTLGSVSTVCRIPRAQSETGERRRIATLPAHGPRDQRARPDLVVGHRQAAPPGQTDVRSPIGDPRRRQPSCGGLHGRLAREPGAGRTPERPGAATQGVERDRVTLHAAANGPSVACQPVGMLLVDLG